MMQTPIPNSYWVIDGLLLAGEYPGGSNPEETHGRLERFLDAGIRVFYDLTERGELRPYEAVLQEVADGRGIDVTYERVPIRNRTVPEREQVQRVLASIGENIEAGRPCYVHCWGGVGRTGTMVGCWLVERQQLGGDDALGRIAELRAKTPHAHVTSPETDEQCAFVAEWLAGEDQDGSRPGQR